jgi:hypothetical protein
VDDVSGKAWPSAFHGQDSDKDAPGPSGGSSASMSKLTIQKGQVVTV